VASDLHLLYVDDDRINLMLFEHSCATVPGLRLSTASSGVEALELARADPPQLLLIDLHLTDTDGYALLQALRGIEALAAVPAFLCSADHDASIAASAADAGFAGCWRKPMDRATLCRELAALGPTLAG
jgi:CheY-like chemotaxis protein